MHDILDLDTLPEPLRYGLALGGAGRRHLTDMARAALARPETARLGLDLALAAWESAPLDGAMARLLQDMDSRMPFLERGVRQAVRAAASGWHPPADVSALAALAERRDHDGLRALLERRMAAEPANLFWRQHALDLAYLLADWDWTGRMLHSRWPEPLEPARTLVRADMHFQTGEHAVAAKLYQGVARLRPALFRLGTCRFLQGEDNQAQELWRQALERAPWNSSILLRLHDSLTGLDRPGRDSLPGGVCVCLYTCGRAPEVDATLAALFESSLEGARVLALDNASPAETAGVLKAWRDRSAGRLELVELPVNIGAPAARNWLKRLAGESGCAFTAYLDDDALVPPDWQASFADAVRAYPQAGVWGCKVVDLAAPCRVQHADVNLLPPGQGTRPEFAALCAQELDFGQFDALRPCLSVTGCFHLFRTERLLEAGDFDIRFSPTQYDDLDHDLRRAQSGSLAACQAHLRVRHARLSGSLAHRDAVATANGEGNMLKLAVKHPPERLGSVVAATAAALLTDLNLKARRVRRILEAKAAEARPGKNT
ncbi:glycosyltransferase [Fundidesulfovibrio soli]|uniref:glycosyltransferase n=1 Tax=Fundidesulfovibrio soli TaxID=2922716 RepID=UPI001FAFD5F0|nr:glycosyltransferase [Fundidesulfovibrio soli]